MNDNLPRALIDPNCPCNECRITCDRDRLAKEIELIRALLLEAAPLLPWPPNHFNRLGERIAFALNMKWEWLAGIGGRLVKP